MAVIDVTVLEEPSREKTSTDRQTDRQTDRHTRDTRSEIDMMKILAIKEKKIVIKSFN